jgi:hypothetical protein
MFPSTHVDLWVFPKEQLPPREKKAPARETNEDMNQFLKDCHVSKKSYNGASNAAYKPPPEQPDVPYTHAYPEFLMCNDSKHRYVHPDKTTSWE